MLKAAIVADDLTGANDTGAIIAQDGYTVGTVLNLDYIDRFEGYDILSTSTESRGMEQENAYAAVKKAAARFKTMDCKFFSKRIDSTLRGNVGAEIDAILEELGEDTYAVVVASFPGSGRTVVGDYLMVNHVPLEKTEVSRDPISPVTISKVTDIVRLQSKHKVGYISLSTVMKGHEEIKNEVLENAEDCRVIVIDARTDEDIREIAKGCIGSKLKFTAIDPGPFTGSVIRELYANDQPKGKEIVNKNKKILCSIGSASALTRIQIKALKNQRDPYVIKVNTLAFFKESERKEEISRVIQDVVQKKEYSDILAVVTALDDSDVLDFSKIEGLKGKTKSECAVYIATAMAEICEGIKEELQEEIGGVYLTGGDISAAYCERIKAIGFDVKDEVIPLAIYSEIIDKDMNRTHMITKGGLVGDENTLITCIDYLQDVI
ncbi:four-carbon acid sugar kinase family protein [Blautia liquoris]|uniref:Four-carbon acid sugar kinase family protein n=1 Tax=Blautia liquoris TaxID=2779518 RepID=A0A7M2REL4_9FIRM|nr:four-carbon acid sugar kinase family protein [Blautia liquoris]QOV18404.1 four-carbon acid sugar kinase family protein [Blautia liquoris]